MSEVSDESGSEDKTVEASNIGRVEWIDLSVDDASRIKDFYCAIVGWSSTEVEMGSYNDFNINLPGTQDTIAGICHARGSNANLPSQWLIYVRVESVKASATQCE
jgi:predicted enzyme related to lactoylglutathione lyase